MKISGLNYNNYLPNKPKFTGINRAYGKIEYSSCCDCFRNDTKMFRNDLDWVNFVKFLQDNFRNKEKVNVYSLASSDGSEGYSFLISLFETLPPDEQTKFLPVYASDQDAVIINLANSRKINLSEIERVDVKKHTQSGREYFINPQLPINIENTSANLSIFTYEPIDELKKAIVFEQADILEKVLSIKDEGNSVLMCRNVTPYMKPSYLDTLISAFQNNFQKGSVLVLGDYDLFSQIDCKLFGTGFVKQMKNVYKKL